MTQITRKSDDDWELTRKEGADLFDQRARQWLGISGDEFVRAWEAGEFDDAPDRPEVMHVAMLRPLIK